MDYLEITIIIAAAIIPITFVVWSYDPDASIPPTNYYVDAEGDVMFF